MSDQRENLELEPDLRDLLDRGTQKDSIPSDAKTDTWESLQAAIESGDLPEPPGGNGSSGLESEPTSSTGSGESAGQLTSSAGTEGIVGKLTRSGVAKIVTATIGSVGIGIGVYVSTQGLGETKGVAHREPVEESDELRGDLPGLLPLVDPKISWESKADSEPDANQSAPNDKQVQKTDGEGREPVERNEKTGSARPADSNRTNSRARRDDPEQGTVRTKKSPAAPVEANKPKVDLAAEQKLISEAQRALRKNNYRDALEALDTHRARFPDGQLSEHRRVHRIRALQGLGRFGDAANRARNFLDNHPESLFADTVSKRLDQLERKKPEKE